MHRLLLLALLVFATTTARAHTPAEFLEVFSGQPSNPIEHGIEIKSLYDNAKVDTQLTGPSHFAMAVGRTGRKVPEPPAYLSVYRIDSPAETPNRKVEVLDLVRGTEGDAFTIGRAEYFLSPAQRITSGAPADIPEGLDHYKAYKIIDAPSLDRTIKITGDESPSSRTIGKPIYLCIAAEEWHHEEYFEATHPRDCFVIYEFAPQEVEQKIGLIDQFGLNQFKTKESTWFMTRGVVITK